MRVPDAALQGRNGAMQEMGFVLKKTALGILAALAFAVPAPAADFDLYDGKTVASLVYDGTDVKTRKVGRITVDGALRFSRKPSVKYRGIFLNDIDPGDPAALAKAPSVAYRFATAAGEIHGLDFKPGAHTLTVYALDPGLILDRLEIAFDEAPHAYGPVPETRIER
jgi:hypothetical protein